MSNPVIFGPLIELPQQENNQTVTKLLAYMTDRHREDLENIIVKLHTLEEQFGMSSELFHQKFHSGELEDTEEFFRWDALIEMRQRIAHRLAILLADTATCQEM